MPHEASSEAAPPAPRRRSWLAFGLRTLLALMLVAAIALAWLSRWTSQVRWESQLAESVRAQGGQARWDYEVAVWKKDVPRGPPGPEWSRRLFGQNAHAHLAFIVHYHFDMHEGSRPADDVWMAEYARLPGLEHLEVRTKTLTDDGLRALAHAKRLKRLWLFGYSSPFTNEGLNVLRELPELRELLLDVPNSYEPGLEPIGALTQLQKLRIKGPWVTDEELQYLLALENLEELTINSPEMTMESLRPLTRLPKLRRLTTVGGNLSEEDKQELKRLAPEYEPAG